MAPFNFKKLIHFYGLSVNDSQVIDRLVFVEMGFIFSLLWDYSNIFLGKPLTSIVNIIAIFFALTYLPALLSAPDYTLSIVSALIVVSIHVIISFNLKTYIRKRINAIQH